MDEIYMLIRGIKNEIIAAKYEHIDKI